MIQDIYPSKLYNSFRKIKPGRQDYLLHFDTNGKLLSKIENGCLRFTTADETSDAVYLFSVDDIKYFPSLDEQNYSQNE